MSTLAQKLQMKPGKKWFISNAPENYLGLLDPLPENLSITGQLDGPIDGVQFFVRDSAELAENLATTKHLLGASAIIWVIYPKKAAGIKTDLEMTKSWEVTTPYGLRPVAAVSINEYWTALRLRPEEQTKVSEFCNEQVEKNDHSAYIDLATRKIIPPPDMHAVLAKSPAAITFFESLSFTNKKEYVVWILSAKQEKTRTERLGKITEKLLAGKKNPSEK